jgi:hypothetical protein
MKLTKQLDKPVLHMICIREGGWPDHISAGISITLTDFIRGLPQFFHTYAWKAPQIRPETIFFQP